MYGLLVPKQGTSNSEACVLQIYVFSRFILQDPARVTYGEADLLTCHLLAPFLLHTTALCISCTFH